MAPEQATASHADVRASADIYALGAILYELLTGRAPFQGTSMLDTLEQVRTQQPVPLRRLNPKLPRDLETIALKCLEKQPSRRYASANTLAGDLHCWLGGKPISARPVSPIEHAWRWCRRQPVIAALAMTLLLTLLGSVLGLAALLRRSEANYRVASRSLDGLTSIFIEDENSSDERSNYYQVDQRRKAIEITRIQAIELVKQNPFDIGGLRRLAEVDSSLAAFCKANEKRDEARSLSEEAIGCLEKCLAVGPDDMEIRQQLFGRTALLLHLLRGQADDQLYERWNARAIAMLERLDVPHPAHVRAALSLTGVHRLHANRLMQNGESDRAARTCS